MNVYLLLIKHEAGALEGQGVMWAVSEWVFETSEAAVTWAEQNLAGQTWRLVMIAAALLQ
jgi:hypothetical protein